MPTNPKPRPEYSYPQQLTRMYKVMPTGCWFWTGKLDRAGYGRITIYGISFPAYYIMFRYYNKGFRYNLQLDHKCSNRQCVNPEHLEPVTPSENVQRAKDKNFSIRVEKAIMEYLSGRSIEEIRVDHGFSQRRLDAIIAVAKDTI